jgi:hypothetical protein
MPHPRAIKKHNIKTYEIPNTLVIIPKNIKRRVNNILGVMGERCVNNILGVMGGRVNNLLELKVGRNGWSYINSPLRWANSLLAHRNRSPFVNERQNSYF